MKKIILTLAGVFAFAVNAIAIPYTWVDTITTNKYVGTGQSVSYQHDITDNGFTIGIDKIYNYSLELKLYDASGNKSFLNKAMVNQPGLITNYYFFNYLDKTLGWSIDGVAQLNKYGTLDITVKSLMGDFFIDNSKLTANGNDAAPVPEPGTMVLLGFGLLGLAIYGKRRMNKES